MKLSIEAELVYNFVDETQVIAKLDASRTSDQIILSESLDIQPPSTILPIPPATVTGAYGLRSPAMSQSAILP